MDLTGLIPRFRHHQAVVARQQRVDIYPGGECKRIKPAWNVHLDVVEGHLSRVAAGET